MNHLTQILFEFFSFNIKQSKIGRELSEMELNECGLCELLGVEAKVD